MTATVAVAITPAGTRAYVTNKGFFGFSTVSVLDINPGGRFLSIASGASLTSTGTASLLHFGSAVTTGKSFIGIEGTLQLQGPLVEAVNNTTLSAGGSFLGVFKGGTLTDAGATGPSSPLLSFTGGSLTSTAGNIVVVSGNPGGTATMTLTRPLFSGNGTTVSPFFHFLRIADGGSVCAAASPPTPRRHRA